MLIDKLAFTQIMAIARQQYPDQMNNIIKKYQGWKYTLNKKDSLVHLHNLVFDNLPDGDTTFRKTWGDSLAYLII